MDQVHKSKLNNRNNKVSRVDYLQLEVNDGNSTTSEGRIQTGLAKSTIWTITSYEHTECSSTYSTNASGVSI
jgi:hypothetical protein